MRCGSSLLAAILADAGADFGLSVPFDWSPDRGALEHPDIDYVSRQFRRASYLLSNKRSSLFVKYLIDIRRSLGKRRARRVLREVRYAKSDNLDLWIWHLTKMGYRPRIIVSFRNFAATARSFFVLRGVGLNQFAERYSRIYGNALLMLDVFGGCAVSFEELVDVNETAWAEALAQATSLPSDSLLHYRNERLKQGTGNVSEGSSKVHVANPQVSFVEERLRQLKGCFIPASPQIRRMWCE